MTDEIEKELQKHIHNGKVPCAVARKIAEDLGVSYKEVGEAADRLAIKVAACELGCF